MKKFVFFLLLIFLVACGGGASVEPTLAPTAVVPTDAPQATPTAADNGLLPPPVMTDLNGTPNGQPDVQPDSQPTAEPTAVPDGPWPTDRFGYGIQVHGNATVGDPADTMVAVSDQLKLDWVKIQVQWWLVESTANSYEWIFYDSVIKEAKSHGLHVMVSIVGAPAWSRADGTENGPPDDYNLYANFLTQLLQRYPGQINALEVWNEENLDREWKTSNGISPEDYVRFLQLAYTTIKAQDPNIIVISGALSPTGDGDWVRWADDFAYLDKALAAGLLNYADCVGAHHNGYNIGPSVAFDQAGSTAEAATAVFRGPFDTPHHSWSFRTTLDTYAEKIHAYDPNKKLCVTEFGWATSEGYDQYPTGFEFAQDNTLQEQADYIVEAYTQMRQSGNVWLAFLFNFDFGNKGNGPTDDPVPYSIVDTQGIPRAAFGAVAEMEKFPQIGQ